MEVLIPTNTTIFWPDTNVRRRRTPVTNRPRIYEFPYCCTGKVIARFGESLAAEGGDFSQGKGALKQAILEEIDDLRGMGGAFISATTNNKQLITNSVLLDLGFKHSKWMSKDQHPETKVRLWWLELN